MLRLQKMQYFYFQFKNVDVSRQKKKKIYLIMHVTKEKHYFHFKIQNNSLNFRLIKINRIS